MTHVSSSSYDACIYGQEVNGLGLRGVVNAATEKGYTPIFTAAEHHNTAVALLLMDNGADMTLEVWP